MKRDNLALGRRRRSGNQEAAVCTGPRGAATRSRPNGPALSPVALSRLRGRPEERERGGKIRGKEGQRAHVSLSSFRAGHRHTGGVLSVSLRSTPTRLPEGHIVLGPSSCHDRPDAAHIGRRRRR